MQMIMYTQYANENGQVSWDNYLRDLANTIVEKAKERGAVDAVRGGTLGGP
jgi:hypothetical protein